MAQSPERESNGMWERSLIIQSFMLCGLGAGLIFVIMVLSVTPETMHERFGGMLAPFAPFVVEPWNMIWAIACIIAILLSGYFSLRYEKKAEKTDSAAHGSKYVDRAWWRRVIITLPVVMWFTSSIWVLYFAWQHKQNEHSSAMLILRDPSIMEAILLYGVPIVVTLMMLFRTSKQRRFGDDY